MEDWGINSPAAMRHRRRAGCEGAVMGSGSSCLVFFSGPTTLADAARALSRSMHVVEDGEVLLVRWPATTGPELTVGFSAHAHVAVEAAELAQRNNIDAFNRFDRRFEVAIDDLETTLDEMNTLAEVQMTLQDLTNGYLVCSWNDSVQAPFATDGPDAAAS
jgi:hypothetical protein